MLISTFILFLILLKISCTDLLEKKIYNKDLILLIVFVLVSLFVFPRYTILQHFIGGILLFVPLFLLTLFFGGIGGGDLKLCALMGFLFGFDRGFIAFAISMFLAGFFCLIQLALKQLQRDEVICLGPFLCIGLFVMWLVPFF